MYRLAYLFRILALLIAGAVAIAAMPAMAATPTCTGTSRTINVAMPATISPIARNAQPGDLTVLTSWVSAPLSTWFTCTAVDQIGGFGVGFEALGMTKSGKTIVGPHGVTYTIWNTAVPGVGIAVGVRPTVNTVAACGTPPWTDLALPGSLFPAPWHGYACNSVGTNMPNGGEAEVALVKIGTISSGTVLGGTLFEAASFTSPSNLGVGSYSSGSFRISFSVSPTTFTVPTCSTSSVTVTLPTMSPADLAPVNKVAGTKPFSINLTCQPGNPIGVYMTLTDNTQPGNTTNNLTLAAGSTATGVKIRIANDTTHTDISYGPDSAVQGNLHQFKVGTLGTVSGSIAVPFTASYVSTSSTVTGGTVKAIATFTMSYQ